jgi:aspartyl-tRNA(Asn)/glutamyl-tRNA(Gln) amidotransferase subunit A
MLDELTWMPAWQIRDRICRGEVSPVEVLEHFLRRIEEFNPTLKAFAHLDAAGARKQAREAEAAVRGRDQLGPLHGIPISVKEHIAVAGMPIIAMMAAATESPAAYDDLGIARLREAGAVIVGTNTMMGTSSPGFMQFKWEAEARNPWDPSRVPGWSSSGGAATAAARLLPMAIGSDGGGSTRLPAAYSGLVGIHPSAGLVPSVNYANPARYNPTITIGPLARDVRDCAIALQVMAGPDWRDFDCIEDDPPDFLEHLDEGAASLRLAWTDDYGFTSMYAFEESPRVIAAVRAAAMGLKSLGAEISSTNLVWEDFFQGYMTTNYLFGSPLGPMPRPERAQWVAALETRQRNWRVFRKLFADYDLLLSPTSQLLAAKVEDWAERWAGKGPVAFPHQMFAPHYTSHTHMFNWLGFPAINVPAGFIDGLPIGLQIVGPPRSEAKIFRVAHGFLKAFPRPEHPMVS